MRQPCWEVFGDGAHGHLAGWGNTGDSEGGYNSMTGFVALTVSIAKGMLLPAAVSNLVVHKSQSRHLPGLLTT